MSDVNLVDVTINLRDVYGKTINDKVEILFYNQDISGLSQGFKVKFSGESITIPNIPAFPTGRTKVVINPNSFRSKVIFKNFYTGQTNAINEVFFVLPDKANPKLIDFADIANKSYGDKLGKILDTSNIEANFWNNLDRRNRATILNLSAKILDLEKKHNLAIFNLIEKIETEQLTKKNRARIFARVKTELVELLGNSSQVFEPAPGIAHHFYGNWHSFVNNSFKSRDKAGNIQFTLATNNDNLFLADIDFDDHSGIQHVAEVIKHTFSGIDTDPFDIHQILRYFQNVEPEYLLL